MTHLLQRRAQHVAVSVRQPIFLQPQDQLAPLVRPQRQQVDHPFPQWTLRHLTRALTVGERGGRLLLGLGKCPPGVAEVRVGKA